MGKGYSQILRVIALLFIGILSLSNLTDGQTWWELPFAPGMVLAAEEIPPAPPFTAPTLRADQIWQMEQAGAAGRSPAETSPSTSVEPSVTSLKSSPGQTRKDTGLGISPVLDPNSLKMVEAQKNQVLVRFKPDRRASEISQALTRRRTAVLARATSTLEKIGYVRVRVPAGSSLDAFLADLASDSTIESVEPNVIVRSSGETPAVPIFGPDWGLRATHTPQAWQVTRGDPSIVVAVVDSGISADHQDLTASLVPGHNFITDNADTRDEYGHGTQVAGIIAGRYNEESLSGGVAPFTRLMPLKVLDANGEGTVADVAEAVIFAADSGTRVINLALGTYVDSGVLRAAVEYAAARQVLVIAAAGNNGADEPAYPAAYPQTLAVGAVDQFLNPCAFSNRAAYLDVAAPGKEILTTSLDGGRQELTGTSAAAAHVSGLAALLLAVEPDLSPENFQSLVRASAVDLQASGWDPETGFGLMDAYAALNQAPTASVDVGLVKAMVLPQHPRPGQTANIYLTLRNHGLETATDLKIVLKGEGQVLASLDMESLGPKETREIILPWTASPQGAASMVSLVAELAPLPGETSTSDNTRLLEVALAHGDDRNLAILKARVPGMPLTPGAEFSVETTLANLGNVRESNVVLTGQGLQTSTSTAVSLDPGECRTIVTQWMLPDDRPGPDEVIPVYALVFSMEPVESENTTDNTLVLKLGLNRDHGQMVAFHLTGDTYSDNEYVHQWIAREAYEYFISQIEGSELGAYLGTISGSFTVANSNLLEGTFAEDRSDRDPLFQGSGDPDPIDGPFMRHFCAGADGSELGFRADF